MSETEYVTMRCSTFKGVLSEIVLWYKNPKEHKRPIDTEMRRLKLHGLTCKKCKKHLEEAAATNTILVGVIQEIRDEEDCRKDEVMNLISEIDQQEQRELVAESMYFFLNIDEEEAPPNSLPSLAFLEPRPSSRSDTDPRHAHFEKTLDVDGDD